MAVETIPLQLAAWELAIGQREDGASYIINEEFVFMIIFRII